MDRFLIAGIDHRPFEPLFALSDRQLLEQGARRRIATGNPGFPCRVSLMDAEVGDEMLLLPYEHLPTTSPYRASGPIFVRRRASRRVLEAGEVPPYVARRLISFRAYDATDMMIASSVCEGTAGAPEIERLFTDPAVAYLHLHNAKQGCFSCRVDRA